MSSSGLTGDPNPSENIGFPIKKFGNNGRKKRVYTRTLISEDFHRSPGLSFLESCTMKQVPSGVKPITQFGPSIQSILRENADLHRPVPKELNIDSILCLKTEWVFRNDFTVSFNSKLYQIEDKTKATTVIVQERPDGTMLIRHEGRALKFAS